MREPDGSSHVALPRCLPSLEFRSIIPGRAMRIFYGIFTTAGFLSEPRDGKCFLEWIWPPWVKKKTSGRISCRVYGEAPRELDHSVPPWQPCSCYFSLGVSKATFQPSEATAVLGLKGGQSTTHQPWEVRRPTAGLGVPHTSGQPCQPLFPGYSTYETKGPNSVPLKALPSVKHNLGVGR